MSDQSTMPNDNFNAANEAERLIAELPTERQQWVLTDLERAIQGVARELTLANKTIRALEDELAKTKDELTEAEKTLKEEWGARNRRNIAENARGLAHDYWLIFVLDEIGSALIKGGILEAYQNICIVVAKLKQECAFHDDMLRIECDDDEELFMKRRHLYEPHKADEILYKYQAQIWLSSGISEATKVRLARLTYPEYLETNEWRWLREKAFDHYGKECAVCRSKRNLDVHHRGEVYPRRGEEATGDLIVLCRKHHAMYHGKAHNG